MEEKTGTKGGTMLSRIIYGALAVVIITLGILYVTEVGKFNKADMNLTITGGQLTAEKNRTAELQTKLTSTSAQVTSLTADLATANGKVTTLTSDLSTANGKVTTLTSDLSTANGKVTTLTSDLVTANGKVTTLTSNLAVATNNVTRLTADLAKAQDTATNLTVTLLLVGYPRHFYTVQELTDWLARDDTNSNPAYTGLRNSEKAYILMVKALQSGFILSGEATYANNLVYYSNKAIVGGAIYFVNVVTDEITLEGTTTPYNTRPLQPFP